MVEKTKINQEKTEQNKAPAEAKEPLTSAEAELLKECEVARDEYLAGWQRAKADFENYKKQESERFKNVLDFEKSGLLLKLISVYDHLEMAKEQAPKDVDSQWLKGVIQIEAQMLNLLKEEGIEVINPVREKSAGSEGRGQFNPDYHEAVEAVKADEAGAASGAIIEVAQKGYSLNGRVLRPAKVKVAK